MSRTELILAATDWSENSRRAVQRASRLAAQHGARGMLVHVAQASWPSRLLGAAGAARLRNNLARLRGIAQGLRAQSGIEFDAQVQQGKPATCIAKLARAHNASLITIGRWTNTALISWTDTPFEESIALRLLKQTRTPVLIAKSEPDRPYRRVLVAVDLSDHAKACLDHARSLAPDAQIILAHAIDDSVRNGADPLADEAQARQRRASQHEAVLERTEQLLADSCANNAQVVKAIERAYAPKFILDMEGEFSADLIVIGRRSGSRFRRIFFNGITAQVLARSRCDVLIVPPSD